jgi:hypothetical protein
VFARVLIKALPEAGSFELGGANRRIDGAHDARSHMAHRR